MKQTQDSRHYSSSEVTSKKKLKSSDKEIFAISSIVLYSQDQLLNILQISNPSGY
jgi:hypothetical protein